MNNKQRGFTLIEIVVGIVVLAVSLTVITSVFLPQANKMTAPMYQIKATALGKSTMNQVLIRYYDEQNLVSGSFSPCATCTAAADFGTDGIENRNNPNGFNDVDDYNVYCDVNGDGSVNTDYDPQVAREVLINNPERPYNGYGIRICVTESDKFDGDTDAAKRIVLTVFMPNNETITLTSFKGNY